MALRPLKSFFPTADDLLTADRPRRGEVLLVHLNSYDDRVKQGGVINRSYLNAMLENRNVGLGPLPNEPEYGARQPEVTRAVMDAWDWLEEERMLMHAHQPGDWFSISGRGQELLKRHELHERWEKYGVQLVKEDLVKNRGRQVLNVGSGSEQQTMAWDWVHMKEGQTMLPPVKRAGSNGGALFIADIRIDELRKTTSSDFDFQKLIRLCEELNSSFDNGNYYAAAMLTRGILDHVPPLFGATNFTQVANNYAAGSKSFKETMQHLQNTSRKVSDDHLHGQIRKSETLPTAQQVWCGQQIDMLLAEIVRITK
jgi:hypothetical protein